MFQDSTTVLIIIFGDVSDKFILFIIILLYFVTYGKPCLNFVINLLPTLGHIEVTLQIYRGAFMI